MKYIVEASRIQRKKLVKVKVVKKSDERGKI